MLFRSNPGCPTHVLVSPVAASGAACKSARHREWPHGRRLPQHPVPVSSSCRSKELHTESSRDVAAVHFHICMNMMISLSCMIFPNLCSRHPGRYCFLPRCCSASSLFSLAMAPTDGQGEQLTTHFVGGAVSNNDDGFFMFCHVSGIRYGFDHGI